ncbi:serine/threonine protein kinase [Amycolatopsis sp. NBC_01488]|uniref:serine/threonine-protein kinase n=1 Tax=Amycolatopsis sp. NBC_01488 TaxID=2903563 RepID=UPI002E29F40E|nr:serine/threonine-protein kinase [Amycolatopsis sp. NBC_01488]
MLSSGQLLADRYKLTSRIAVGGMGEVWQASDTRLDRTVAVKILKAELSGDAEFLHRFRTEARMTASLNHPGIAAVHDYGETLFDGDLSIAYLVMELVDGDPLAGLLAKHGRLSAEFTLDMLEQAGNALQAAHEQGLVHRDVKPGNILVTPAGQVKITDFGVAKAADAAPVTRSGMVMGTAHYIAPEQALGHPAEPASDVYSLAVCGYECLAGHRPFLSENAVTVAMMHIRDIAPPLPPDVPPAARAVIEATLVKDPRQRYNSGGEFAAAVAAVRAGLPLPTPSGLVNATFTGQQPVVQQPPSQPVPPQQQHMPVGPPSPAVNPMVAIGPPSRPVLRPAMVPVARKKSQWGWWALLAAILLVVLVAGIVLVAKMIGSSGSPPHTGQTTSQVVPGRQPPAEQPSASSAYPADTPGTTDDGQQGIMTAPWTEWNGTQR